MFASNTSQVSSDATYIEDVFSTWLYAGTGSTLSINNGIDLAGKGGMTWIKNRPYGYDNCLFDTARGANKLLISNSTAAQASPTNMLNSFNSNGFTLGDDGYTGGAVNASGSNYASWTFRKQPKFFDVVTYTGDGVAGRAISHSLGSEPGCIIIKCIDAGLGWVVGHRGVGWGNSAALQSADPFGPNSSTFNSTAPTSTVFTVGNASGTNSNGNTYVAYLFAHNAGGFGLTGTDNVISCGSFAHNFSGATVNLGWEPQWVLVKAANQANDWYVFDNMRGIATGGDDAALFPNLSNAENLNSWGIDLTATGFTVSFNNILSSGNAIYIAIRRGPMKTPTSGTSVFMPTAYTGNGANNRAFTTGFVSDMVWWKSRSNGTDWGDATLLIGPNRGLTLNQTSGEGSAAGYYINTYNNTGFTYGTSDVQYNGSARTYIMDAFSRAPGFFDVVCWAGDDTAPRNINHNLTVVPEMMIVKRRSGVGNWVVYHKNLLSALYYLSLNATNAQSTGTNVWRSTAPTATVFTVGNDSWVNTSGDTYVAYLFASCPGVSKVGSYTGNGSSQTINCGFTGGARFVLIKRTDNVGDWYVWDSARGITSGNDPYLLLNKTDAEITTNDTIDPDNSGFIVNHTFTDLNGVGNTYIYLAIA